MIDEFLSEKILLREKETQTNITKLIIDIKS